MSWRLVISGPVKDLSMSKWSVIGELVEDLSVSWWLVVGGWWFGGEPVGGSVVGGFVILDKICQIFCESSKSYIFHVCSLC